MMPGTQTTKGMMSFMPAAKTMPFWPSASDLAPEERAA